MRYQIIRAKRMLQQLVVVLDVPESTKTFALGDVLLDGTGNAYTVLRVAVVPLLRESSCKGRLQLIVDKQVGILTGEVLHVKKEDLCRLVQTFRQTESAQENCPICGAPLSIVHAGAFGQTRCICCAQGNCFRVWLRNRETEK